MAEMVQDFPVTQFCIMLMVLVFSVIRSFKNTLINFNYP